MCTAINAIGGSVPVSVEEMASRASLAVLRPQRNPIRDVMKKFVQADMNKLQEGISVLRSAELIAASHQLRSVMNVWSTTILKIEDPEKRKVEITQTEARIQELKERYALLEADVAKNNALIAARTVGE